MRNKEFIIQVMTLCCLASRIARHGVRALAIQPLVNSTETPELKLHLAGDIWATSDASPHSSTIACDDLGFFRGTHADYVAFWAAKDSHEILAQHWFNAKERAYGDVFNYVLRHDRYSPLDYSVLDVGTNTGWYSLFAATRGYTVVGFDMQPECVRRARCAIAANRLQPLVDLHYAYVTHDDGAQPINTQAAVCLGNVNPAWEGQYDYPDFNMEMVQPLHLGRFLHHRLITASSSSSTSSNSISGGGGKRTAIMKVDIEGGEVSVARSLSSVPGVLRSIEHILMEYSPLMWAPLGVRNVSDGVQAFAPLFSEGGFAAVDLPENYVVNPAKWQVRPETGPGVMRSVTDLADYTDGLLRALEAPGHEDAIYTLWFFREQ